VACAHEVGDLRVAPHKAAAYENVRATCVPRHQLYRRLRFRLVSMRFSLVSMRFSLVSGLRCVPRLQLYRSLRFRLVSMRFSLVSMRFSLVSGLLACRVTSCIAACGLV
jgi:hypothetical protein